MEIFGFTITRTRTKQTGQLSSVESRGGWWPIIRESFAGAWQQNVEIALADVLSHPTVFSCVTLIACDIAKCRLRLVERDANGIWTEAESPAFSPVLRKPNRYQNRINFVKVWVISRLVHGNTYVLKQRDARGVVVGLYVLDPTRVRPLVAEDGSVYYELKRDPLSNLRTEVPAAPASEIIHDLMYPLYHPLVGLSPIYASGLAATLGLRIYTNSAKFFSNGSQPGGILTAPGAISDETALRLKAYWETNFTGDNIGKVAVLGDGLKYEPMMQTAKDALLTEQWKGTAKAVCSTYHVPAYKVGVEPPPSFNNIEALDRQYYAQCLQEPIESIELLLDEGLGLTTKIDGRQLGTEFDLDDLMRLDTATLTETLAAGTGAGIVAINEARGKLNLPPAKGGDEPILQQQNWPLSQLANRPPPPAAGTAPPAAPTAAAATDDDTDRELDAAAFGAALRAKADGVGLLRGLGSAPASPRRVRKRIVYERLDNLLRPVAIEEVAS